MKPQRREISIFNVSTIDLFASALGAFMVVSFVLLPYFPNTSTRPPDPTPPTPVPTPAPGVSTIQKLPAIDLVIALDTTGSMRNEVASLREEIAGLSELLGKLSEEAAVGIIEFKDRCDPGTALRIAPIQLIDPDSVKRLTAFARSMSPGGSFCNDTAPEDFAEALRAALGLGWRDEAERRSIVMISDNPAHQDMVQQAIADAGRFAARPGAEHTVSTIWVDTSDLDPSHAYIVYTVEFMRRVAEAGGGQYAPANENASLSLTILNALFGD